MEKFDPTNPEYKKVSDLPEEEKNNFVDVPDGGFVKKEANEYLSENRPIYDNGKTYSLETEALDLNNYAENRNYFINEAPKLIRDNDSWIYGIVPVAKKLGVWIAHDALHTIESLLRKVLDITNNFDKDALPLLDAVAGSIIQLKREGYSGWSHSVCHLIETYRRTSLPSFLDTPQSREVLTKLVDESVRRQKESSDNIGCSSRIVGPIASFNLIEADTSNLEQPYVYKPESLSDSEYIKIMKSKLKDEHDFDTKAFLDTKSPLEFYSLILEKRDELPEFLNPERQMELLEVFKKYFPQDLINKFVQRAYSPNGNSVTYDELIGSFKESKESKEVINGVYVDVEGTLILNDSKGQQSLNGNLVQQLEKLIANGREVIIFTGGDITAIGDKLKELGFPEHFLPVRSKNEYRGKVLEVLIDDTPPEYQGFRTLKSYTPHNAWF